jgi:ABC-type multidrug transport system ATPase subunit
VDWNNRTFSADSTLANLGLSRVANSPVGDIKRRGVSGGEKKRVNLGLELMCRPQVLFLDEPTSGLVSVARDCFRLRQIVECYASNHLIQIGVGRIVGIAGDEVAQAFGR